MKKIKNIHRNGDPTKYQCFGCSPFNEDGLKLEFWEDGDTVISYWQPEKRLMGWYNVLHGGIQATLMDEVASWVVYVKCMTAGVTADLKVRYKKPVLIENGQITITGRLKEKNSRVAIIETQIISNNTVCAEGELKYFIFPEKIAKEKWISS
jgi:acyl-coenzyme A thioesterase PaaI-like protein